MTYHEERFPDDYGFEGELKEFPRDLLAGLANVKQFYMGGDRGNTPTIELEVLERRIAIQYFAESTNWSGRTFPAQWDWFDASTWGFDSCDFSNADKFELVKCIEKALDRYLKGRAIAKEFVSSPKGRSLKATIRDNRIEWDGNLFYGVQTKFFSYVNMSRKFSDLTELNDVLAIDPKMEKYYQSKIAEESEESAKKEREGKVAALRKAGKPIPKHLR